MRWNVNQLYLRLYRLELLLTREKNPKRRKDIVQDIASLKSLIVYVNGKTEKVDTSIPYSELDKRFYENLEFLQHQSKKIAEELYPFTTIRRVPSKPFFTRKIKKRRYYPLVEEFLKDFDMEIYEYYLKLIREERIEVNPRKYLTGFAKGETTFFSTSGKPYVSTRFNEKLDIASTLPHEVIHAYQLEGIKNRKLIELKITSLFKETYSIFIEYAFFDFLKKTRYKKHGYREEGCQLDELLAVVDYTVTPLHVLSESKLKNGIFYTKYGRYTEHYFSLLLSEILALYFFDIYRKDKEKAKELLKEFNDMLGVSTDEEILEKFGLSEVINGSTNVLRRYLKEYK